MKTQKVKILKAILNIDLFIAIAAATVLILITFAGVLFRYFLNSPRVWVEEVQLACFVWILFFGASAAIRNGGHVSVDVFVDMMGPKQRKAITWFVYIAVTVVLLFLLFNGYKLFLQMLAMNRRTDTLKIPSAAIYSAMPISCLLMLINFAGMRFAPQIFSDEEEDT